jgi:hypothetical protein
LQRAGSESVDTGGTFAHAGSVPATPAVG